MLNVRQGMGDMKNVAQRNLAAMKAMIRFHPVNVNGETLHIKGIGTPRFTERVVGYPAVLQLMMQEGMDIGAIIKEAPGFVVEVAVESLVPDGTDESDEHGTPVPIDDLRDIARTYVMGLPPDEFFTLAEGVFHATFPDGIEATKKKIQPLLAKFKTVEGEPAKGKK